MSSSRLQVPSKAETEPSTEPQPPRSQTSPLLGQISGAPPPESTSELVQEPGKNTTDFHFGGLNHAIEKINKSPDPQNQDTGSHPGSRAQFSKNLHAGSLPTFHLRQVVRTGQGQKATPEVHRLLETKGQTWEELERRVYEALGV